MNPAKPPGPPKVGYYVSSIALEALSDEKISQLIRDHWSAIENGVHYRRDVSFQEDQCRVKDRVGAEMLAACTTTIIIPRGKNNCRCTGGDAKPSGWALRTGVGTRTDPSQFVEELDEGSDVQQRTPDAPALNGSGGLAERG